MKTLTTALYALVSLSGLLYADQEYFQDDATAQVYSGSMPKGREAPAPQKHQEYCKKHICVDESSKDTIPYTRIVKKSANYALNFARSSAPMVDKPLDKWGVQPHQGVEEEQVFGNCASCALSIQRQLRAMFPKYSGAFRLATIDDYWQGQSHLVLTIETPGKTYACDCTRSTCTEWDRITKNKWWGRELPNGNWERYGG